jgi:hypothetical protein
MSGRFGGTSGRLAVSAREGVGNAKMRSCKDAIAARRSDNKLKKEGGNLEPNT